MANDTSFIVEKPMSSKRSLLICSWLDLANLTIIVAFLLLVWPAINYGLKDPDFKNLDNFLTPREYIVFFLKPLITHLHVKNYLLVIGSSAIACITASVFYNLLFGRHIQKQPYLSKKDLYKLFFLEKACAFVILGFMMWAIGLVGMPQKSFTDLVLIPGREAAWILFIITLIGSVGVPLAHAFFPINKDQPKT